MRRLILISFLLLTASLWSQTVTQDAVRTGWCDQGATKATVSGLSSGNNLQGIIPSCTITVYQTGTTTTVALHADRFGSPLGNPFTATPLGQYTFWAPSGVPYDIVFSGGVPPNNYKIPVTLVAIILAANGGGGGGGGTTPPAGNNGEIQFNAGGYFGGVTGLTWDAANAYMNYPGGTIGAKTFNAATANVQTVNSSGTINGNNISANAVTASGAVSGATLNSTGNATVGGNLAATGTVTGATVTSSGAVNSATISATGNATVGGNLNANSLSTANAVTAGAINATTVTSSGAINGATVTGTGAVSGATLNSTGNATVGGNLAVTGSMGAVNASTVTAIGPINGASVNASGGAYQIAIPWDTGQPNIANNLVGCVGLNGVHACPVNSPAWNGIQVAGGPGSGLPNSILAVGGQASCTFDGTVTVGDYVQPSPFTQGLCHDSGSPTVPSNGQPVMGQVVAAGTPPLGTVLITSVGGQSGTRGPAGPTGPPGPPGGSLSYPGVVSDSNNGLNVTGGTNTASLPGYRQNSVVARSRNRDEVLQITITPQDMPNCANSGKGLIDDAPCWNAALNYLAGQDSNVQRKLIIPYAQYGYTFRRPGYFQPLPHDYGDYHGFAGYTTSASVGLYISNGVVQTCTVNSGSGYAPNAQLPVVIQDPSNLGSGAYAQVQTDVTGTPQSCTVIAAGMNYPATGIVTGVIPLGGDGAAGTATLTANAIATAALLQTCNTSGNTPGSGSSPCGGSGYATWGALTVPVNAANLTIVGTGLVCTTYPVFQAVVTGTSITAVNVTTPGAGCTYAGAATATVPLVFGASCGGAQCTLLAPEPVFNMPCGVALYSNITIEGIGNPTVSTAWNSSSADPSQMIAFCEPSGVNAVNITIKNLTINNAFIGFYFPSEVHHLMMDNVNFQQNVAFPFHAYSIGGGPVQGSGLGGDVYGTAFFGPSVISNITDQANSGFSCGGEWQARTSSGYNSNSGGGPSNLVAGGYQSLLMGLQYQANYGANAWKIYGHWNNFDNVAPCGNLRVENFFYNFAGAHSATTDAWDLFWETYIWRTQNGPASPFTNATNLLSNGLASVSGGGVGCKFQLSTSIVDRTVDYQFGANTANTASPGFAQNYPFYQCFPGITYSPFVFVPRYSGATVQPIAPVSFANIVLSLYTNRAAIIGKFDSLRVERLTAMGRGSFTDPYAWTGTTVEVRPTINSSNRVAFASRLDDVIGITGSSPPSSTAAQFLLAGLPITQNQTLRNVYSTADKPVTVYATTPNLGGSALMAGQCVSSVINPLNGATTGSSVVVSPTVDPGAGFSLFGFVNANNQATVRLCAIIAGTPTATTYNVRVIP